MKPKKDEVSEQFRVLCNKKHHDLYKSLELLGKRNYDGYDRLSIWLGSGRKGMHTNFLWENLLEDEVDGRITF
jgi:hypothetical protein